MPWNTTVATIGAPVAVEFERAAAAEAITDQADMRRIDILIGGKDCQPGRAARAPQAR